MLTPKGIKAIAKAAEAWFEKEARPLNFRENRTPYRVWVSEVMLQQTQVFKVVDYFERFMQHFPTVQDLAQAPEDEVLSYWSGLGYYSRCRNLHRAAQVIVKDFHGQFPEDFETIATLPGIGSYTAGAISAFAFNKAAPVVDGNIARVLSRLGNDATATDTPFGKKHFEAISMDFAQSTHRPGLLQEALMEMGATLCSPQSPACERCPVADYCESQKAGTWSTLPTKGKRAAKKELHGVFTILCNEDQVWLERNESSRLFKSLYAPPHQMLESAPQEPPNCTVVRELTHRTFHMHGYVLKEPKKIEGPGRWFNRAQLAEVGLSSAVTALLKASGFLCFLLMVSCAHERVGTRREPLVPSASVQPAGPTAVSPWRAKVAEVAEDFVGQKQVVSGKRHFRRDCSGTVRAIFEIAGYSLKDARGQRGESDAKALYDYAKKVGAVSEDHPEVGDLVFFHDTYDVNRDGRVNDGISHVGIVTEVFDDDDDIVYVHYSRGVIIESSLDDELRRPKRRAKARTGRELLSGFGKFDALFTYEVRP